MVNQKSILIGVFVLVCIGILLISSSGKMKLGSGNVGNGEDCVIVFRPRRGEGNPSFLRCKTRKPLVDKNINTFDVLKEKTSVIMIHQVSDTTSFSEGGLAVRSKYLKPDDFAVSFKQIGDGHAGFRMYYDKDNDYYLIDNDSWYDYYDEKYTDAYNQLMNSHNLRTTPATINGHRTYRTVVLDDLEVIQIPVQNYFGTAIDIIPDKYNPLKIFHLDDTNSVKA